MDTFWLPGLMWHLDLDWRALRDYTPWVKRLPSEYIREHIPPGVRNLCPIYRAERKIWKRICAGCTPKIPLFLPVIIHIWDWDEPGHVLRNIDHDLKKRIMGENAAEILGLF